MDKMISPVYLLDIPMIKIWYYLFISIYYSNGISIHPPTSPKPSTIISVWHTSEFDSTHPKMLKNVEKSIYV